MGKYAIEVLAIACIILVLCLYNLRSERDQLTIDLADSQAIVDKLTVEAELAKKATKARDTIDSKYTKELTHALAENQKLRDAVSAGTQRVYIKASCPSGLSDPSGTSSLDYGAGIELTRDAGQDYLHLRDQLISDGRKLLAAQAYINQVCQGKVHDD